MPLQTSGQISLNDLQGEFGGTYPASMSEYRGKDCTDITGPISFSDFYGKDDYVTPGSNDYVVGFSGIASNQNPTSNVVRSNYTFTVPCGVFVVHIVCVGGGGSGGEGFWSGGGGGGGSLTYVNNVDVTPGMELEVHVGNGGTTGGTRSNGKQGWASYVKKNGTTIALANGGSAGNGGSGSGSTTRGFAGGAGGTAWNGSSAMSFAGTNATYASYDGGYGGKADDDDAGGGGGAAGYAGRGGHGESNNSFWSYNYPAPNPPTGSGGGSGSYTWRNNYIYQNSTLRADGDRGGGVGLFGKGSDGNTWSSGGSGGANGLEHSSPGLSNYGGGGSGAGIDQPGQTLSPEGLQPSDCGGQTGAPGAVRIMWGTGKSFPNNAS